MVVYMRLRDLLEVLRLVSEGGKKILKIIQINSFSK